LATCTSVAATNGTLTVRAVVDAFLNDRRYRLRTGKIKNAKVYDRYHRRCTSFVDHFGDEHAEDMTDNHICRWLIDHPEWKSGYTIEDAAGAVVACFRWADRQWPKLRLPRLRRPSDLIPSKPVRRPLFKDEFLGVIRESRRGHFHPKSRYRFRAALFFLWRTGSRTCEMREALFTDVDWTPGLERVILPPERTKTGKTRVIPLEPVAAKLVRLLYRIRLPGQKHIFVNGRGKPYTCQIFADMFRKLADKVGVPRNVSAYCTRTSFACRGRKLGFTNDDVADVLGNSPRTVQKHYDAWQRQQADHLTPIAAAITSGRRR